MPARGQQRLDEGHAVVVARGAVAGSEVVLEEVEAVCTRAVVINRGVVVFDGTAAALDAKAPASITRNRLDHVFRTLTTSDVATGAR